MSKNNKSRREEILSDSSCRGNCFLIVVDKFGNLSRMKLRRRESLIKQIEMVQI